MSNLTDGELKLIIPSVSDDIKQTIGVDLGNNFTKIDDSVSEINSNITNLKGDITVSNTKLDDKIDTVDSNTKTNLDKINLVETDVKDSQDKISILSTKVNPKTPLNTTSQNLSGAVNEVKGDLDGHKEDYVEQFCIATNLIKNGNLADELSYWETGSTSSIQIVDEFLRITSTTRPYLKQWGGWNVPANNKIYIRFVCKANRKGYINLGLSKDSTFSGIDVMYDFKVTEEEQEYEVIIENTSIIGGIRIHGLDFDQQDDYIDIKNIVIINITNSFRLRKEPTVELMNALINQFDEGYFDGEVKLYNISKIYDKINNIINNDIEIKFKPNIIKAEHVDFIKKPNVSLLQNRGFAGSAIGTFRFIMGSNENAMVYKVSLEPYQKINIKAIKPGNRFQIGVTNTTKDTSNEFSFDRLVVINNELTEYSFENNELGKELYVYVNNSSSPISYTDIEVVFESAEIEFIKPVRVDEINELREEIGQIKNEPSFGLRVTAIADTTEDSITQEKDKYPVLCACKYSNARTKETGYNTQPVPMGWLYYKTEPPYDLMYAKGRPDNLQKLCSWNQVITRNGTSTPENYQFFITKDGDIICVFRGEQIGASLPVNPDARQNPIIYPAGDYENPYVVDFGARVKPTSWLKNTGADYIYNQDCFIFAEYTRPVHDKCYVWKVTKPFNNPDNWRIVKEFVVSGSMVDGFKHCHTINFDPFSEVVYLATGDDDSAAAIYESEDYGETWSLILGPSEKTCRLTNFIFTKDKIYWASDSGKNNYHFLYEISRNENRKGDFDTLTELWEFPYKPKVQPTYFTALIREPYGLLFLDRFDNPTSEPLDIYFWSFETEKAYLVHTFYPLKELQLKHGFRCDCVNYYQAYSDNRIVCGFGYFQNEMEVLGNTTGNNINRINNLALEVIRE